MAVRFSVPDISEPIIDRATGYVRDNWYRFLELFEAQLTDAVSLLTSHDTELAAVRAEADANKADIALMKSANLRRIVQMDVTDQSTTGPVVAVGDNQFRFYVPQDLHGYDLVEVAAALTTVSASGAVSIQLHNTRSGNDMLLTNVTVDASETGSETAATPPVIDGDNSVVLSGDFVQVDVDGAGSGAHGLIVTMGFE